jgi:hypothetical protein
MLIYLYKLSTHQLLRGRVSKGLQRLISSRSNWAIRQTHMSQSTPPFPLLEDGKLESLGDETHHVESDREKQSVGSNEPSTMASSTVNGVEKPEFPENDSPATEEKAVDEPQPLPVEYPKGIEMFFIMLALVLVITLLSLDQVSPTAPILSHSCRLLMHHTPVC